MKMKNKCLYKTIKALRFYASLFDVETGKTYKLVTSYGLTKSGYFLIQQVDNRKWLAVKEVPIKENEGYSHLPYFTKIQLYQFLIRNYGFSRRVQKVLDSLDL